MDEQLNCNANIVSSYPLQNTNEQDISIFKANNLAYENKKLNINNVNNNTNSETTTSTAASSSFITTQSSVLKNSNIKNNLITNNILINKEKDMSSSSTVASSSDLFSSNCAQQAYFQQQQLALAIQKSSAVITNDTSNFNNGYQPYQMNYSLTNGSTHLTQSQVNDILNNNNNNNNNMSQPISDSPVKASKKVNGSSTPIKKKKCEV